MNAEQASSRSKFRWSSRNLCGEDSMSHPKLAEGVIHTGGVMAATRQQGDDRNWRSPVCPEEKISEEGRPYNCGDGKGAERQQDGGVARRSDEGE